MLTAILVAAIGHKVFPGNGAWWIVYLVATGFVRFASVTISMMNK